MEPEFSPDEPESVFDEIRRQRTESTFWRTVLLRVLGLLVLAGAVWLIAKNVTWRDTLVLDRPGGAVRIVGEIKGDWRAEAVRFELEPSEKLWSQLTEAGVDSELRLILKESLASQPELAATGKEVRVLGGRPVFVLLEAEGEGPPVTEPGDPLSVRRIEWRPGMVRTLREIDLWALLPALGFLVLASLCVVTRWWRLLGLNNCATTWYDSFRYTYSGLFFNTVVPGINGGDVARAVAVVRDHPDRRSDAFMTVVVDRVIGLVGMVFVGTILVLRADERMDPLKLPVGLFCLALVLGMGLFFNGAVRRLVRFDGLVAKLPQGERLLRLDAGARRLLAKPGEVVLALGFSFGNHAFNGLAVFTAARALGTTLDLQDWVTVMAISNTLAAVPLSPGGLGVGEVMFGSLAEMLGSTYAIGVATSLVYRMILYVMSLFGGLVMLLPGSKKKAASVA